MRRLAWTLWIVVVLAVQAAAFARSACAAEETRRAGTVRLDVGGRGPLDLAARAGDAWSGDVAIVNEGREPLVVSRFAIRGGPSDERVASRVTARLVEGTLPVTIAPGQSRRAVVTWQPDRALRVRQLFAHLVVTTSDEASGEVAIGIHAEVPSALGVVSRHVLSLIVLIPLFGALAVFLTRSLGRDAPRTASRIATGALALQLVLAGYAYRTFVPDISRIDGNEGLQLVERVVWARAIGAEIYLGADGTSIGALVVISLVALLGLASEKVVPRAGATHHVAYLGLASAGAGALVAMDGLLLLVFTSATVVMASALVGGWGGDGRRAAATRLALLGGLAVVLLLIVVLALVQSSEPTFLVDGTRTPTTFNTVELSKVAFAAKTSRLLGGSLVRVGFALVLVASVALLGAFPLHGWVSPLLAEAETAGGALVSAVLPAVGAVLLMRVGCTIMPEGARWASGVVVALGAVSVAQGALGALAQTDLRRLAASTSLAQAGFVLVGVGSLGPQGLAGAISMIATRALSSALFLFLVGALEERARTRDVTRLEGVGAQMPGWGAAFAAATLAQCAVLGLGGSWGPVLVLLGALPNYAPLAVVAALGLFLLACAHVVVFARIAFGTVDAAWAKSAALEPFGGRFPDLGTRDAMAAAPLATALVFLGLWPSALLATSSGTVRDLTNLLSPPGLDPVVWVGPPSSSSAARAAKGDAPFRPRVRHRG
jgi:NADH-quinone oxidoreductase subunit M